MNAFIPARDSTRAFHPLRGLISPLSASVAENYLARYSAPGDLVLDPFARDATLARVAQKMERSAIVVASDPVWSWIARALAAPPPASEVDAALARWGDALKDDTPLRAHIDQLYTTICANCARPTPVDFFVRAQTGDLLRRQYTCAHCGATRADPATPDDFQRAAQFDARGFHFHFAFERVVPEENLHAERIRKILALYTPRNLYALVTLTLKADTLFREPRPRAIITLLLLHLLNRGTSFYITPELDASAEFAPHSEFLEFNLWRELERAARELRALEPITALAENAREVKYSGLPRAFVGRGNAHSLARELGAESIAFVFTAPPVSRVPLWALAYFFGAWVFGRAAVKKLAPYLDADKDAAWERRWYSESFAREIISLAQILRVNARAVFAFTDARHVVSDSLLLAGAGAHLELETFLFQSREGDLPRREFQDVSGEYRVTWLRRAPAPKPLLSAPDLAAQIRAAALAGAKEILARRGEALAYSWIHHAAFTRATREGWLELAAQTKLAAPIHLFVADAVREGLRAGYAQDLDHYENADLFLWRRSSGKTDPPLIDRVHAAVRAELARAKNISRADLDDALYRQFPDELTPEAGLIARCARVYAEERGDGYEWRARDEAREKSRAGELLARLSEKLGYENARAVAPFDWAWQENGESVFGFVWRAQFEELARVHLPPTKGFLLIADHDLEFFQARVNRVPHWVELFYEAGWDFLRVSAIEKIARAEKFSREEFGLLAGLLDESQKQFALSGISITGQHLA